MRKKKSEPGPAVAPKSAPRVIVSYFNRTWTDRLAAVRVDLVTEGDSTQLMIELALRASARKPASPDALDELLAKGTRVDTVQVERRGLVSRLREHLLAAERAELSVVLLARGHSFLYPASIVFGPDAITLHLG